jgi:hypothetical protein
MAIPSNDRSAETDDARAETEDPEAPLYSGVELETSSGTRVPQQMNVGSDNMEGGGEWPDPHTPPKDPAPGAVPHMPAESGGTSGG